MPTNSQGENGGGVFGMFISTSDNIIIHYTIGDLIIIALKNVFVKELIQVNVTIIVLF